MFVLGKLSLEFLVVFAVVVVPGLLFVVFEMITWLAPIFRPVPSRNVNDDSGKFAAKIAAWLFAIAYVAGIALLTNEIAWSGSYWRLVGSVDGKYLGPDNAGAWLSLATLVPLVLGFIFKLYSLSETGYENRLSKLSMLASLFLIAPSLLIFRGLDPWVVSWTSQLLVEAIGVPLFIIGSLFAASSVVAGVSKYWTK